MTSLQKKRKKEAQTKFSTKPARQMQRPSNKRSVVCIHFILIVACNMLTVYTGRSILVLLLRCFSLSLALYLIFLIGDFSFTNCDVHSECLYSYNEKLIHSKWKKAKNLLKKLYAKKFLRIANKFQRKRIDTKNIQTKW